MVIFNSFLLDYQRVTHQVSVISRVGGAAFALLKADGSVVAWGDPSSGGQLSRSQVSELVGNAGNDGKTIEILGKP